MSRFFDIRASRIAFCLAVGIAALVSNSTLQAFEGVGRSATSAEIAKWDIDVRPDFVGLPPGEGSVADGETLWVDKCSTCHGDFGDANHVFAPLIGNTTLADVESGRVAALAQPGVRTTMMKIPLYLHCGTSLTALCHGTSPSLYRRTRCMQSSRTC